MDAGAGAALREGGEEERGAGAGFEREGAPDVVLRGEVHDEHVVGGEALLLYAGGGEVDVVMVFDGDTAAGALWLWFGRVMSISWAFGLF